MKNVINIVEKTLSFDKKICLIIESLRKNFYGASNFYNFSLHKIFNPIDSIATF